MQKQETSMKNKKVIIIALVILTLGIGAFVYFFESYFFPIKYKNQMLFVDASFKQLIPLLKDFYSDNKQNSNGNINNFFSQFAERKSKKLFVIPSDLLPQLSEEDVKIYLLLPKELPQNGTLHILAYSNIVHGKNGGSIMILLYANGIFKQLPVYPSLISNVIPNAFKEECKVDLYYISKKLCNDKIRIRY